MSGVDVVNAKLSKIKLKQPILGTTLVVSAILGITDVTQVAAYGVAASQQETLPPTEEPFLILSGHGEILPVVPDPNHREPSLTAPHESAVLEEIVIDESVNEPISAELVGKAATDESVTLNESIVSESVGKSITDASLSETVTDKPLIRYRTIPDKAVTSTAPAEILNQDDVGQMDQVASPERVIPGSTAISHSDASPSLTFSSVDGELLRLAPSSALVAQTPTLPPEDAVPAPTESPTTSPPEDSVPVPTESPVTPTTPPTGETAPDEPVPPPTVSPAPAPSTPAPAPATGTEEDKAVLVSEVFVEGVEGDLALQVYEAISTRPGRTATRSQIQADINAIFTTGLFSNVRAEPSDTPLGVRVTYFVQPNPILRSVQLAGNRVLAQEEVDRIFAPQYGSTLNLNQLQAGIQQINKLYQDRGFVLGQVFGTPTVDRDGAVTLQVAEGQIEAIDVRYINEDGETTKGKTRKFIITRELDTKPGDVLNRDRLQADLQRVFALSLFDDVKVALEPGEDPRKVVVNLNVQERSTGSFSAGAGFSSRSGLFGTGSYTQNNFGGNNQTLNLQVQVGTREFLFDTSFTDPWIATDPYGTSYTVNIFNRLTIPLVFDEGPFENNPSCESGQFNPVQECDVRLPEEDGSGDGDTPRVNRLGGGVTFTRPLTKDRNKRRRAWAASLGLQYQRVSVVDSDLDIIRDANGDAVDNLGFRVSLSDGGQDDLFSVRFGIGRDLRNDPLNPTKGSAIRFGVEQWLPIGLGSVSGTRLRGSYSYFVPVSLLRFTKGPQALAFNVQAGTVLGDLPPYEAFTLGGSSSVRGYNEGDLGSGRSFFQLSTEYRFPLLKFLGGINGVLFFDYGTNLGTQRDVLGNAGFARGKPGNGFGYGVGIRVKTPVGPVRLDYGLNNEGDDQFHFGFGQRF